MNRLLRRLPFFILIAVGLWWWQHSGGPKDRTLTWELLPAERQALSSVQISVRGQGELYRREERFFRADEPVPVRITQISKLPAGAFEAELAFRKADGGSSVRRQTFQLSEEDAVTLAPASVPHSGR